MNRKVLAVLLFVTFACLALLGATRFSMAALPEVQTAANPEPVLISMVDTSQMLVSECKANEIRNLSADTVDSSDASSSQPKQMGFTPRQRIAPADPTNFGDRFIRDVKGQPVSNEPIVVLHETVGAINGVIGLFQTRHPRDDDQVSYHAVIARNGTIYYIVPPDKRAFGAGNSVFKGPNGVEAVQTNPKFPGSVNNFAYHISLETPGDGMHNGGGHSGYSEAQYRSLGWLVAKTGVPDNRITTHKAVDRSGSRRDPRSFNVKKFKQVLSSYPRVDEIGLQCGVQPPAALFDQHEIPNSGTTGNGLGR